MASAPPGMGPGQMNQAQIQQLLAMEAQKRGMTVRSIGPIWLIPLTQQPADSSATGPAIPGLPETTNRTRGRQDGGLATRVHSKETTRSQRAVDATATSATAAAAARPRPGQTSRTARSSWAASTARQPKSRRRSETRSACGSQISPLTESEMSNMHIRWTAERHVQR